MLMKLDAYLRLHKITYRQFAELVDDDAAQINRFATGRRTPSLMTAARISRATNGAVSFEDFLPGADRAQSDSAVAA
jgi:transcriptional regulator with XRE-family HTH domain